MKTPLSANSPIMPYISRLLLFNYEVGDDEVTVDKDYRHVGKRCRNTSMWHKGVDVFGITNTPAILERHFLDSGVSPLHVHSLLQPNDKQDVPLTYTFLAAIANLPEAPIYSAATYIHARKAIRILGEL